MESSAQPHSKFTKKLLKVGSWFILVLTAWALAGWTIGQVGSTSGRTFWQIYLVLGLSVGLAEAFLLRLSFRGYRALVSLASTTVAFALLGFTPGLATAFVPPVVTGLYALLFWRRADLFAVLFWSLFHGVSLYVSLGSLLLILLAGGIAETDPVWTWYPILGVFHALGCGVGSLFLPDWSQTVVPTQ